ncbi:MAG: S8 family serine peptidase [Bdellovibrionales bacterium]|nr:S8 family serine peptidase [Bdellovibrionales bacterium]
MKKHQSNSSWITSLALAGLSLTFFGFAKLPDDAKRIFKDSITPSRKALTQPFKNWGLLNGTGKSHISAPEAWKIEQGSRDVVVAVIDTGIDPRHPDLGANVWRDKSARRTARSQGEFGWDYVTNRPDPSDEQGHGTHVAGIIGATANSREGVSGVAPKVSIMAVKYYSDANPGSVNLANTIKAINYAVAKGARIINYSGGGPEFSEAEYLAIKKAEARGVLFVSAAGNERQDTDLPEYYYYPAAYRLPNIITVAATDIHNNLLPSSNWGRTRVDVAAPGENIYSTLPGGKYGYMSGTSQATAFVTGIAALLLSRNPNLTPAEIKKLILDSVDPVPQLKSRVATGGRVNAHQALLALTQPGWKPLRDSRPSDLVARRPVSLLDALAPGFEN